MFQRFWAVWSIWKGLIGSSGRLCTVFAVTHYAHSQWVCFWCLCVLIFFRDIAAVAIVWFCSGARWLLASQSLMRWPLCCQGLSFFLSLSLYLDKYKQRPPSKESALELPHMPRGERDAFCVRRCLGCLCQSWCFPCPPVAVVAGAIILVVLCVIEFLDASLALLLTLSFIWWGASSSGPLWGPVRAGHCSSFIVECTTLCCIG